MEPITLIATVVGIFVGLVTVTIAISRARNETLKLKLEIRKLQNELEKAERGEVRKALKRNNMHFYYHNPQHHLDKSEFEISLQRIDSLISVWENNANAFRKINTDHL